MKIHISTNTDDEDKGEKYDVTHSLISTVKNIENNPAAFFVDSNDNAFPHSLTRSGSMKLHDENLYGDMVDTGCAQGDSGSRAQYCIPVRKEPNIDGSIARMGHFKTGSEMSQGMKKVEFPLQNVSFFDIHVVTADLLILLPN